MSDHDSQAHGPITRPGDIPEHDDGHGPHGENDHGHGGIGKYMLVFLALCGLTTLSFFTYSPYWPWRNEPQVGWAFMMAVSCTKAMLVVVFFMHVFWEANWKYVLTIPAAMMAIFLAIMLIPDIGLRNRMVAQERALHMARPSDVRLLEQAAESKLLADPVAH
ncbi:MAG: cytochrome C oxidase subunit IV family protein [Planctomycetia bacterium]|jgi:cytochrome c oxidase subunit 4|nr:cytochrome C oxidase subunit IV family protein [Planctomycetia bacterium]